MTSFPSCGPLLNEMASRCISVPDWKDPRILHVDALGRLRDFGESEAAFDTMHRPEMRTLHRLIGMLGVAAFISIGALIAMVCVSLIVDLMEFLIVRYVEAT